MWFLIKGTFWFSLVLVALSYFGSSNDPTKEPSAFDLPSAVSAAGEAYRYVSAICIEKPDVCVKAPKPSMRSANGQRKAQRSPMNCWTSSLPPVKNPLPPLKSQRRSKSWLALLSSASNFPAIPTC
ncbi:conserved exported protein of uncharacterised function [Agrobacterium tumefaciens]|nr:conserved exported protein of uncharacterised function [Agrobacterium tumefaciens]